jgi:phospholipase/carboxylesterase
MNTDLDYNIKKPTDITSESKVIIMLHGYGSNKEDLFSFSDYMDSKALIISVQAPHKMDYGSYCWWALTLTNRMNLSIEISSKNHSIITSIYFSIFM